MCDTYLCECVALWYLMFSLLCELLWQNGSWEADMRRNTSSIFLRAKPGVF